MKSRDETTPPGHQRRYVQTHGDPPPPEGVLTTVMYGSMYPKLTRALNLLRADNAGPAWRATGQTLIPQRWVRWLPEMEEAVAGLSDAEPAPEDTDAVAAHGSGERGYHVSELNTFVSGEQRAMRAVSLRSDGLKRASLFLADLFEGWDYFGESAEVESFDPLKAVQHA